MIRESDSIQFTVNVTGRSQYFTKKELMQLFSISGYRLNNKIKRSLDPSDREIHEIHQIDTGFRSGGHKLIKYYGPDIADILSIDDDQYIKLLKGYVEHELDKQ